ncbi:MAG: HD domain-containing protein [Acidimicrobiales bacterium]
MAFIAPIAAGWGAVRLSSAFLYPAPGGLAIIAWVIHAIAVSTVAATVTERVTRRFLPLATLLGMTLTFPDQAPSRYKLALRSGTVHRLQAQLADPDRHGLGHDAQHAAETALQLVTVLGRHERLTRGHTERVRAYADLIATQLALDDHDRQLLAWSALLHDIGKLAVPATILNKAGRPTDDEWAVLATHPAEGAKLIEPLAGWLGDWSRAPAEHHERWDGRGYPNGLAGTDISLAGRIVAVADAYDVITSRRSYKAPMTTAAARKELVDCAGTQFDPRIVRAFLEASIQRNRRFTGWLSWLPELPRLPSILQTIATTPATLAVAAVAATAPLANLAPPPHDIAYTAPAATSSTVITTTDNADTTPTQHANKIPAPSPVATAGPSTSATITTLAPTTSPSPDPTPTTAAVTTTTVGQSTRTTAPPPTTASPSTVTAPASSTSTPTGTAGPTANNDSGSQKQGQQKQHDVLTNDQAGDASLDPTTLTVITQPAHGTATIGSNHKIRYQADPGYTGTIQITYRICDTAARCAQATLTIELTN